MTEYYRCKPHSEISDGRSRKSRIGSLKNHISSRLEESGVRRGVLVGSHFWSGEGVME
jgi:hypothetical protein